MFLPLKCPCMYIIMEYILHTWTRGLSMNKISEDAKVLKVFYRRKVITVDTLSSLLDSSVKTARRRLKLWEAYTSYNENGRYYTLPDIPEFDANGLWSYRSIRFSKYGNLKQTAIQLIRLSRAMPTGGTTSLRYFLKNPTLPSRIGRSGYMTGCKSPTANPSPIAATSAAETADVSAGPVNRCLARSVAQSGTYPTQASRLPSGTLRRRPGKWRPV